MNAKKVAPFIAAVFVAACLLFLFVPRPREKSGQLRTNIVEAAIAPTISSNVSSAREHRQIPIRKLASDFTTDEKAEFLGNFEKRYKPAIQGWVKAYAGHIPFGSDAVSPDKLVERVGADSSFSEYVFVIDGITFSVRDSKGLAQVGYLNDPEQTKKMQVIPKRATPPVAEMPLRRQEISDMILADGGTQFSPDQIRTTPSGFSGGLDGGVIVHIGGDPRNGATWKFDMVFGPDGKLAYYLRGM